MQVYIKIPLGVTRRLGKSLPPTWDEDCKTMEFIGYFGRIGSGWLVDETQASLAFLTLEGRVIVV